ncbi:unnamed protein product [Rhizophagus irregularis]|uniref:Uncharacterized protein n=1 Tax=Rhizophagus irregularis TaxID=588596 RepID=A0A915ZUM7_9GLOM|nr:unnamed protein product [Rhizophagus irregularis]CAB5389146.1 unnamed protein product [Rhizophagus irregularis]
MPEEFKQLEIEEIFTSYRGPNPSENSRNSSMQKFRTKRADNIDAYSLPHLESLNYMTLTDAAMQHRLYNRHGKLVGNLKTAYKCFEAYANLGNTGAL